MRQHLEAARASGSRPLTAADRLHQRAFDDLDNGQLRSSAEQFESALALNSADADALGGLAIVRLRERRPREAKALFERALAANPTKAGQWRRALDAANYALSWPTRARRCSAVMPEAPRPSRAGRASREVDDRPTRKRCWARRRFAGQTAAAEQHFLAAS